MYHQSLHFLFLVALNAVLALNGLGNTHRARNINAENNRDILVATEFLVQNLGCSLNQIVDFIVGRDFFVIYEDLVVLVTELALPHFAVLSHYGLQHTVDAQYRLAFLAQYWVTCGHHTSIL